MSGSVKSLLGFRFSINFTQVKTLIEFLRKSCLLTLCRKHNKSKTWVYGVYTPNLLVINGLFNVKSFFPTKNFISKLRRGLLYKLDCFYLDEEFFLSFS